MLADVFHDGKEASLRIKPRVSVQLLFNWLETLDHYIKMTPKYSLLRFVEHYTLHYRKMDAL